MAPGLIWIEITESAIIDDPNHAIETEEMMTRLKDLRCDLAQGYRLSRPLPPDKLEAWLDAWQASADAA